MSFQYKRLLGYRKGEDGKPEIVPEEAAIVERILKCFSLDSQWDLSRRHSNPRTLRFPERTSASART